ncbi:MAG: hypothetical protein R3F11_04790 [Verrucomicrobiales bacterium]
MLRAPTLRLPHLLCERQQRHRLRRQRKLGAEEEHFGGGLPPVSALAQAAANTVAPLAMTTSPPCVASVRLGTRTGLKIGVWSGFLPMMRRESENCGSSAASCLSR